MFLYARAGPFVSFLRKPSFSEGGLLCSYFLDEADLECLFCINGTACDEHVKGAVCADHAGEHVYAAGIGAEADAYKGLKKFSIVCGKNEITPESKIRTAACRCSRYGTDNDFRHFFYV